MIKRIIDTLGLKDDQQHNMPADPNVKLHKDIIDSKKKSEPSSYAYVTTPGKFGRDEVPYLLPRLFSFQLGVSHSTDARKNVCDRRIHSP